MQRPDARRDDPQHAGGSRAGSRVNGESALDSPVPYVLGGLALIGLIGMALFRDLGPFAVFSLLYLTAVLLACGWWSARLMRNRGRSARAGWALGLLLNIWGVVIAAVLPPARETDSDESVK